MVQNFIGGVSNIPNQLKGQNILIPTGYGTAATNQSENFIYNSPDDGDWKLVHTVPTGKTFYVSTIIFSNHSNTAGYMRIGTGEAASEVIAMSVYGEGDIAGAGGANQVISMNIPMKFSSATKISIRSDVGASAHFTLIGWQE